MDNKNADVAVKVETNIESKDTEQEKQLPEAPVKKSMKEEKSRKKDDKSVEQVLKALNSLDTTEEKLAAMCKKYSDIVDENRKLQVTVKQTEKRLSSVQREKEQLQTEHSKAVLTRSRLESLCRELQRQNKAIKDESLLKIREEEEKRKEVSAKFQSTLNEITTLMQQNNEKNSKLREDNLEMTKKFKTVCEQYELREQQVEKITKQMQLEAQLADAKLAKAKMEMAAEKEALLKEKQQLLMDLTEYQARCQELQTTEVNLRSQISLYTDKYDEFQNALSRSNEVFGGFKGEMEKMSKKICKLEKETSSWKQRWEKSHQALLEMAADKQQRDSELALATRQLAQMQKLCRTLQAERTSLLAQLRTEGASKDGVSASIGKTDAPVEPLQLDQETVSDSENAQFCRHESQEACTSTQPQIEACQEANSLHTNVIASTDAQNCQNTEDISTNIITQIQNVENVPTNSVTSMQSVNETSQNAEECLSADLVQNVNVQVIENTNCLVTEEDLASVTSVEPTEKNHSQETESLNTPSLSETLVQNQKNLELPDAQLTVTDSVACLQNETHSINPVSEKLIDVSSLVSPSNEHISMSQDTSSESLVNGQIEALDTSEINNKLGEKLPESNTTAAVDAKHIAENGIIEQIPVLNSPTDSKKGKEGGKKRKNK